MELRKQIWMKVILYSCHHL